MIYLYILDYLNRFVKQLLRAYEKTKYFTLTRYNDIDHIIKSIILMGFDDDFTMYSRACKSDEIRHVIESNVYIVSSSVDALSLLFGIVINK